MTNEPIDRLAEHLGIAPVYRDQEGTLCKTSDATKRALLKLLGVSVDAGAGEPEEAIAAIERRELSRLVPPVAILREDMPREVLITSRRDVSGGRIRWRLSEESGRVVEGSAALSDLAPRGAARVESCSFERRALPLPDALPPGYHALELALDGDTPQSSKMAVIVTPRRAFWPRIVERGVRLWGLSVQLYGVRSSRNWGIGDFTDLRALLEWAGPVGAAAIGINPLHALYLDDPSHISPYSPSSRVFINPLYIDVEAVDDFAGSHEARILVDSVAFRQELERLRSAALVDYAGVAALKLRVLELLHRAFRARSSRDATLRKDFDAFRDRHGVALDRFAVFQVLRETFGARDPSDRFWRRWPAEFQDPHSASVAAFARAHAERVEFFCYLQWQAELQLSGCVEAAHLAGLPIGLYLDLAVGTDTGGADSWADSDLVATGATIGAPPDTFHRLGQNWGLPPPNAGALRERAFQPFVDLLRANMRWAGALRIDHVLGLQRLFWIPEGATPAEGAYVAYPFDELIGLVALESHRNRCMVIGEDLGTLPEGFQAAMRSAGLLSYCLLFFERDPDGRFRSPHEYPTDALAAITTHDLPTLWGYWDCEDIDARASVGAFPGPADTERDRDARRRERAGLVDAFGREGLVGPDQGADSVPFEATLRFIARTPCRVLMVGFEDLLGVREQANLPGTVHEYPNWRRKLPMTLEAIMSDRGVLASADVINAERPPVWRRGSGT